MQGKGKSIEPESRSMVARTLGRGGQGYLMGMGFSFGVIKVFCNWIEVIACAL